MESFILDSNLRQAVNDFTTVAALVNLGAQKYGYPIITFAGKKYNSKMVLKAFEHRVRLNINEITICKMMKYKLEEHLKQLQPVDEYGNCIRSEDEVLNKYLAFIRGHVYRLNEIIDKNL